jgi:hypothetical protein
MDSEGLRDALQQAKARLLFQQQAELLLTELLGKDAPPANWRELTTGALTQVVCPAANGVIILPTKRAKRPLVPCPIVSLSGPKLTGFELSKAVWNIPASVLPHAERCVLRALTEFYGLPYGIRPCNKTLAELTGFSKRTVQRALDRLQDAQYIAVALSSNRKGNPEAAKSETPRRTGGRSITTVWVLNVNGILELASGEKDDSVSPFDQEKGDSGTGKGDTGSQKGDSVSRKGDSVSPEQSISRLEKQTNSTNVVRKPDAALVSSFFSKHIGNEKASATLGPKWKTELKAHIAESQPTADDLEESIRVFVEKHPWNDTSKTPLWLYVSEFENYLSQGRARIAQKAEMISKHESLLTDETYRARWEALPEDKRTDYQMERAFKDYEHEVQIANAKRKMNLRESESFTYIPILADARRALVAVLDEQREISGRAAGELEPEPELFGAAF